MGEEDAANRSEKSGDSPLVRGRHPQGIAEIASNPTARREPSGQKTIALMEAAVERENMFLVLWHCLINGNDFNIFHEPPCTEPYARWCGRTGEVTSPPTR
jgi:hypothetical protein